VIAKKCPKCDGITHRYHADAYIHEDCNYYDLDGIEKMLRQMGLQEVTISKVMSHIRADILAKVL